MTNGVKQPKILFFIDGPATTPQNDVEANALRGKGAVVNFRNARYARSADDGGAEVADGVMGATIPDMYKTYPTADEAIDKYNQALTDAQNNMEKLAAKTGQPIDNNGTVTYRDPARTPVAAPTQPPSTLTSAAPVPATQPAGFTTTVGTEKLGQPADASGVPLNTTPVQPAPGNRSTGVPLTTSPFATK